MLAGDSRPSSVPNKRTRCCLPLGVTFTDYVLVHISHVDFPSRLLPLLSINSFTHIETCSHITANHYHSSSLFSITSSFNGLRGFTRVDSGFTPQVCTQRTDPQLCLPGIPPYASFVATGCVLTQHPTSIIAFHLRFRPRHSHQIVVVSLHVYWVFLCSHCCHQLCVLPSDSRTLTWDSRPESVPNVRISPL
jgi:hypothetical protein